MTELDTAAIRAEWYAGMNIMDAKDCIRALCDALDAAREDAKCDHGKWRCKWGSEQRDRAEAAEARIAAACAEPALDIAYVDVLLAKIGELSSRAEAAEAQVREDVLALDEAYAMLRTALARAKVAEARIAAALAWFADTDCTWTYRVEMARRALTEGTGQ